MAGDEEMEREGIEKRMCGGNGDGGGEGVGMGSENLVGYGYREGDKEGGDGVGIGSENVADWRGNREG